MSSLDFNPQNITYKGFIDEDEFHRTYIFQCSFYEYSAKTLDNIIQFIKGQDSSLPKTDGSTPTEQEENDHQIRKEIYNGNHQPLQDWIDSL